MTTPAPLPCPFCAHPEPTVMHDGPSLSSSYTSSWVWCEACNSTGPAEAAVGGPDEDTMKADAIAAWNRAHRQCPLCDEQHGAEDALECVTVSLIEELYLSETAEWPDIWERIGEMRAAWLRESGDRRKMRGGR